MIVKKFVLFADFDALFLYKQINRILFELIILVRKNK
jgi:hypothetical protein